MTDLNDLPIVVGVSETTGSGAALRWAAAEAARRRVRVVAVLAWSPPRAQVPSGSIAPGVRPPELGAVAATNQHTLETLVIATLGSVHGVQCRAEMGSALDVLVAASLDAQLVVIDAPRPGRFSKPRKSLLAPKLAYNAACPVVVIPPEHPARSATQKVKDAARSLATAAAASAAKAGRPGIRTTPPEPIDPTQPR
jgi:Universal stress protein family